MFSTFRLYFCQSWNYGQLNVNKSSLNSKNQTTHVPLGFQNSNPYQDFSHSITYSNNWWVSIRTVPVCPVKLYPLLGLEHEISCRFGTDRFLSLVKSYYVATIAMSLTKKRVLAQKGCVRTTILFVFIRPIPQKRAIIEEVRLEIPETETALIKCPLIRLPKEWRFHLEPSQGGPVTWLRGAPQPRVPGVALCCVICRRLITTGALRFVTDMPPEPRSWWISGPRLDPIARFKSRRQHHGKPVMPR